tara:strand:+ start:704 stop:1129 length:426 start_codon:yes stop_codon:yes gene_type:complete
MTSKTKISDVSFLDFNLFYDSRGSLCPIEFHMLPIDVKRLFYVYGVPDRKIRGEHAHYKTNQILICISGSCQVICKDGESEKNYMLDSPDKGLLIPKMIWDEQIYETKDTVLLVLSDTEYNKDDYIEDWEKYLEIRKNINV